MIDGDDGTNANFVKEFGGEDGSDPDWFKLTISGKDSDGNPTGSLPPFFLADYQAADDADDYVIADWTWVDLTGLGANTRTLEFWLNSSDTGLYGINTPTYFAVDNLRTVPEPGTAVLVGVALLLGSVTYRLRLRRAGS